MIENLALLIENLTLLIENLTLLIENLNYFFDKQQSVTLKGGRNSCLWMGRHLKYVGLHLHWSHLVCNERMNDKYNSKDEMICNESSIALRYMIFKIKIDVFPRWKYVSSKLQL